ncbi:MAG: agmatine deiminase [Lachnospiraceae bacterium]|nr:agmatine deiminase [Lachnospiraceae bacterium]
MAKRIYCSTPKEDGFYMPGEFEKQQCIWMIWPERPDNWRSGAVPAQKAYADVAKAIVQFEPVIMLASKKQFENCRKQLPLEIKVIEMESDDAWARDVGPSFLINKEGKLRACDWTFNAWGGDLDGLYKPWDKDDKIARQICEIAGADFYRTEGFVLEGGSFHVDGEGTVMVTEMCLLSKGRNPEMSKEEIEKKLCDYLNCEKVIWLKDGIDPEETNGHIDDVACFTAPGEAACIYTEDETHSFYQAARAAYRTLCGAVDAKGRRLKVHKVCCTKKNVYFEDSFRIENNDCSIDRKGGDLCIASYLNFLIVNGGVIVPQYGDENDALALKQIQEIFPERKAVGVMTREIVYGGGNIHCITQQQPLEMK